MLNDINGSHVTYWFICRLYSKFIFSNKKMDKQMIMLMLLLGVCVGWLMFQFFKWVEKERQEIDKEAARRVDNDY